MKRSFVKIPTEKIVPPTQPIRDNIPQDGINELADSIKQRGLLQPIMVRPSTGDTYEIVAGHRRYLACVQLSMAEIDCMVDQSKADDIILDMAHENLIRENLNVIEEAKLIKSLVYEGNRGVDEVAHILSKSNTWVENRMEILSWPSDVIKSLEQGEINIAVAKEVAKVKNESQRQSILESAISYGVPARVVKQWIDDFSVHDYLHQKKISKETGELISVDAGPTYMPCRVCGTKFEMNLLRHVWLCPDCIVAVRGMADAVQNEMKGTVPQE